MRCSDTGSLRAYNPRERRPDRSAGAMSLIRSLVSLRGTSTFDDRLSDAVPKRRREYGDMGRVACGKPDRANTTGLVHHRRISDPTGVYAHVTHRYGVGTFRLPPCNEYGPPYGVNQLATGSGSPDGGHDPMVSRNRYSTKELFDRRKCYRSRRERAPRHGGVLAS